MGYLLTEGHLLIMGKFKAAKSSFASGAPPCPVSIDGAKPLNKGEMLAEYNGLLIILAAIIEHNNGRIIVTEDSITTVKRQRRVLQIVPGHTGLSLQFNDFKEEALTTEPEEAHDFLGSSVAQEAREFLAKQRETNDSK